ncbi:MAG TPA: M23 family metallopeptidase [Candidatus Nanoarchaeia archaeon]
MLNSEESESGLSFSTTSYTYELDFVQDDFTVSAPWFSIPLRILKRFLLQARAISLVGLRVGWESFSFSFFYLLYIQKRIVAFIYALEDTKDALVKILMWRRGLLFRPTIHGGVLVLASVAFIVGSLFRSGVAPEDFSRDQVLAAANTPQTIIPEGRPRSEMVVYTVNKGDSVSTIAAEFKVSVSTIKWANTLTSVDSIKPGDTLKIPPITGMVHKVNKGDTIASVAKKYKADAQTVAVYPFNYIDDSMELRVGQTLFVPGGKMPPPTPIPSYYAPTSVPQSYFTAGGNGIFAWPAPGGINQYPSWFHPAIDIGAAYGTGVQAAAAGTVTTASYLSGGFGNAVFVSHGNGYTTAYAHLGSINVGVGQTVSKGQLIGAVGCTGFCTGPHLHFEVRHGGSYINPLSVLP